MRDYKRTIVVIHPGALGDLLLSLSAIRALRRTFPAYDVGLVAQGEVSRLFIVCREAHAVFPIETQALTDLLSGSPAIGPKIHAWLQKCDMAVAWMADHQKRLRVALQQTGIRQAIVQSPMSPSCLAVHQEDRFLETIDRMAPGVPDNEKLTLPLAVVASAKAKLETIGLLNSRCPLILLHPGSGSLHKCGNPSLFAETVAYYQSRNTVPVIIGGPADDAVVARVSDACKKKPATIQHEGLLSMAGILSHAAVFVGYDSGLSHLAVRLHVPTVAVFGPTNPRRWAPRGPNVTVLTGAMCRCQGWEEVVACHEKPCLRIPVENLVSTCEQMLKRQEMPIPLLPDRLVMSRDLC